MPTEIFDGLRMIPRHSRGTKVISMCTEPELTDVDFNGILNIFKTANRPISLLIQLLTAFAVIYYC